jgi:uncharacterized protein (TIGR03435 family)
MSRRTISMATIWMTAGLLHGQSVFEAASVKPLASSAGPYHFNVLPNRLDVKNINLAYLVEQAYDVPEPLLAAPEWMTERHFDIAATSGAPVSREEMRAMLRNLLTERFHLATHWDNRTEAMYRLVVMPGGPKMKPLDEGYAIPNSPTADGSSLQFTGPMSMRQLAERLTHFAGRPVLDGTNLEGYFRMDLRFANDSAAPSHDTGPIAPPLPKAIEQQLGLKLVPGKEPIRFLVVDHADQVPTGN